MESTTSHLNDPFLSEQLDLLGFFNRICVPMAALSLVIRSSATTPCVQVAICIECSTMEITAVHLHDVLPIECLYRLGAAALCSRCGLGSLNFLIFEERPTELVDSTIICETECIIVSAGHLLDALL